MEHLIQIDEVLMIADFYAKYLEKPLKQLRTHPVKKKKVSSRYYKKFCVVTDNNIMGKYTVPALDKLAAKTITQVSVCAVVGNRGFNKFDSFPCNNTDFTTTDALCKNEPAEKTAFLIFLDCDSVADDKERKKEWLNAIENVYKYASSGKDNRCILCVNLPDYPAIPGEVTSLAERELDYYLEEYIKDKTPGQEFFRELQKVSRKAVRDGFSNINILRASNVFAPCTSYIKKFDLPAIMKEIAETKAVNITPDDYKATYSVSYIRDVIISCFHILHKTKPGHVFNFNSFGISVAQLKERLHERLPQELSLTASASPVEKQEFFCTNTLKLKKTKLPKLLGQKEVLYRTLCVMGGLTHDNFNHVEIYSGKLGRIKELEIQMLRDIDRICRENNIKYFLAGGTMLGAVRYGHSIPWDDDFDIGMQREDFDKFRQLCKNGSLNSRYAFASSSDKESGSHYIVDKVRLKDTYFSTNFSSVHEIEDGVFIDVLVYDRTCNNPRLHMPQSKFLFSLSTLTQIIWYGKPRKNFHYKFAKFIIPVFRVVPFSLVHKVFEFTCKLFNNSKDSRYLLDSMGKLQRKGPLPREGLDDVQYVDYDFGFKAPIPEDYTGYLTFDYGPNFLPEPNISNKVAPHNFARIDLGEYVFQNREAPEFRRVNLKGELFEDEK